MLAEEEEQTLTVEAGAGGRVAGDAAVLRRALVNLLHNAIKYTPANGLIRVTVRRAPPGDVVIEVADSGPGIAPAHRDRIFERFYRADAGRARDDGGVGLGLALARWAVEANGVRLELDSEEGRGVHAARDTPGGSSAFRVERLGPGRDYLSAARRFASMVAQMRASNP